MTVLYQLNHSYLVCPKFLAFSHQVCLFLSIVPHMIGCLDSAHSKGARIKHGAPEDTLAAVFTSIILLLAPVKLGSQLKPPIVFQVGGCPE